MQRVIFFVYGAFSHVLFLAVYAWMAAFVGNFGFGLIRTIDGPASGSPWGSLLIDVVLIAGFTVPHSVMARPGFKAWWVRFVPPTIERSTYVLVSNLLMISLLLEWRPIGGTIWSIESNTARWMLHALFIAGWLMVPAVSMMIHHFDLFGSRQVWLHLRGRTYSALPFRTPGMYRFVRHPLYIGWMIAFWATPTMSMGHMLFAGLMTAYMLIAIPFEERDLVAHFGDDYVEYRDRVGGLIPRPARRVQKPDSEVSIA